MTVEMLREHGVAVDDAEPDRWVVAPGPVKAADHVIEPDLSNAAPFLGLAAVTGGRGAPGGWPPPPTPGAPAGVAPRHPTQAGDALRDLLGRMGCAVAHGPDGLTVTGTGELAGIDADL